MKVMDAAPSYCSSCFQQAPDDVHIDMEAAWDGPILDADGTRYTIDDLYLCATCVRAAASMLPENRELQVKYDDLLARYQELMDYHALVQSGINNFERALATKLEPVRDAVGQPRRRAQAVGGAVKVKV